jgi:hypothetical protein
MPQVAPEAAEPAGRRFSGDHTDILPVAIPAFEQDIMPGEFLESIGPSRRHVPHPPFLPTINRLGL